MLAPSDKPPEPDKYTSVINVLYYVYVDSASINVRHLVLL